MLTVSSVAVVQLFLLPFSLLVIQSPFSNMSATSASTSTSVGKCVVCGKETWMRCSACSKAGLDWMWFCSGEHQKLVSTIVPHIELTPAYLVKPGLARSQARLQSVRKSVSLARVFASRGGRDSTFTTRGRDNSENREAGHLGRILSSAFIRAQERRNIRWVV